MELRRELLQSQRLLQVRHPQVDDEDLVKHLSHRKVKLHMMGRSLTGVVAKLASQIHPSHPRVKPHRMGHSSTEVANLASPRHLSHHGIMILGSHPLEESLRLDNLISFIHQGYRGDLQANSQASRVQ